MTRIFRLFGNIVRSLFILPDWFRFRRGSDSRFPLRLIDCLPRFGDKTAATDFDLHYIYHPAWAARILATTRPAGHVDFSSTLSFSTIVSAFLPVRFYDFRPAAIELSGLKSAQADLTKLSFASDSLPSVSCLHTIEHIGLGRYGDPLDPQGDLKALLELQRVTAPGGDLLIAVPIGHPRLRFNAHRIYSYDQLISALPEMTLQEFSLISEQERRLIPQADPRLADRESYGCGCFWFKKKIV